MDVALHIDGVMRAFAEFLRQCAPVVAPLSRQAGHPEYWNGWVQANWEALVEAALPATPAARLSGYGGGAARNGQRGRPCGPRLAATHFVTCRPRGDLRPFDLLADRVVHCRAPLAFDRFVTLDGQCAIEASPFDCVRVRLADEPAVVFPLDAVTFHLSRLER